MLYFVCGFAGFALGILVAALVQVNSAGAPKTE